MRLAYILDLQKRNWHSALYGSFCYVSHHTHSCKMAWDRAVLPIMFSSKHGDHTWRSWICSKCHPAFTRNFIIHVAWNEAIPQTLRAINATCPNCPHVLKPSRPQVLTVHTSWICRGHHTCDISRSGVNLPIWRLPFRPPDEAAKIPIFMKSDFSLLPKAKTCFPITVDACFI